jgi:hypothetical protein
MATSTEVTLELSLPEFRKAVAAVTPHAEPTKTGDEINHMSRVRLTAAKSELLLAAGNSITTALAAVPIEEDSRAERFAADDGVFDVDVTPGFLRGVLQAFKVAGDSADGQDQFAQLTFTTDSITITDVSGLFPGRTWTEPVLPRSTQFPGIVGILSEALAQVGTSQVAKPLITSHPALGLFRSAGEAYRRPLSFEGTGPAEARGFVVLCGSQFIGSVSSRHNDDDSLARRDAERHRHLVRLGLAKERVEAA